jgi:hypothetical protein
MVGSGQGKYSERNREERSILGNQRWDNES